MLRLRFLRGLGGNQSLTLDDGETTLYSLMCPGGSVLVDGAAADIAGAWIPRVRTVRVRGGIAFLVRPDGCIAWAADDGHTDGLASTLAQWLGSSGAESRAGRGDVG